MFENLPNDIKKDIDSLVDIAIKYRDKTISRSLFVDVFNKYIKSNDDLITLKEYLNTKGVEVVFDDEIEDYTLDRSTIKPFDTNCIDISPKPLTLDLIISRLEYNEINLMPDFQRKSGLWSQKQKSQLIESLLLRIPLPAFYFDGSNNDTWIVIDGLQRLTVLREFFIEKTLRLTGLEFLHDLENSCVNDLPNSYIRRMKETQIVAYIINPGAPIQLKYNIFKRINTGGLELDPQEIRHALYQGHATRLLKEMAEMELFKKATGYSISTERMLDREFILRFIAFSVLPISEYDDSIDDFLNNTMEYINKQIESEFDNEIKSKFELVLDVNYQIFGKYAFRRIPDYDKRRQISKALFENWTSILTRYDYDTLQLLIDRKDKLLNRYIKMCNDSDFITSLSGGKNSAVRKRYEKIKELIDWVITDD
ncbi:MAG: DUF262 domain-containing protein [Ruminococcus sp.]|uniref:DUF262 domain-containing protein n=1 Tax=Ruminococcus sp. TaxID=41978 RepID=UPI0025CE29D5|nr:DUF262 domain-containing protein [Ruminococcus sp.]MCR5541118.1 DUF262 domain-containing protein [Ruminococcus sp.]